MVILVDVADPIKTVTEPIKTTITIFTKLYNDNMVWQILQVIVVDIILVSIFYLITFFFFNKETGMGEDGDAAHAAHGISKSQANAKLENLKFSEDESEQMQQNIKEAMRRRFAKQIYKHDIADGESESKQQPEQPSLLSLEKLQRKLDLDRVMPEWSTLHHGTNNPWNWFKLLEMFTDDKVKQLCGSDAALYLAFLRMSSKFFLAISTINCGVLYLYLTGQNNSDKIGATDSYAMKALTILNIAGVTWKVFIVYLVALGAVVALKIILISVYSNMFHMDERLSAQSEQQKQEILEMAKDVSL